MFSLRRMMLIMQYGPSSLGFNLLYVGLFCFEALVLPASSVLSTATNEFVSKTQVSSMSLF